MRLSKAPESGISQLDAGGPFLIYPWAPRPSPAAGARGTTIPEFPKRHPQHITPPARVSPLSNLLLSTRIPDTWFQEQYVESRPPRVLARTRRPDVAESQPPPLRRELPGALRVRGDIRRRRVLRSLQMSFFILSTSVLLLEQK